MFDQTVRMIAYDWAERCFGKEHVADPQVRTLRIAEEVVELVQAFNIPKDKLHTLIDIVYSRPKGTAYDEFCGVLLTIIVFAQSHQWDIQYALMYELRRVLSKSPEHFAKRNKEKLDLGLTGE